jgi:hypothetical protein
MATAEHYMLQSLFEAHSVEGCVILCTCMELEYSVNVTSSPLVLPQLYPSGPVAGLLIHLHITLLKGTKEPGLRIACMLVTIPSNLNHFPSIPCKISQHGKKTCTVRH